MNGPVGVLQPQTLLYLRWILVIGLQGLIVFGSVILGFNLRFDFDVPESWVEPALWMAWIHVGLYLAAMTLTSSLSGLWRYVTLPDALLLLRVCMTTEACLFLANLALEEAYWVPRSVYLLTPVMSLLGLVGLRVMVRVIRTMPGTPRSSGAKRILIAGAGDAGFQIVRELVEKHSTTLVPVGFLDDDPAKQGERLFGLPVLGTLSDLETVARAQGIQQLLVAIPSAPGSFIRNLVREANRIQLEVRALPGISSILDGRVLVSQIRDVSVEDLLRRPQAELDRAAISKHISGRVVLVTGAGGSIGSELCRQVLGFGPRLLILADQAETSLYQIDLALREAYPDAEVQPVLCNLCEPRSLEPAFAEGIDVVLHAAAYKHVPLLEANPQQAVLNNILATQVIAKMAIDSRVGDFVMVSSDKAVRPTSVMGASKRICEVLLQAMALEATETRFKTVRFGNVLGSSGSVVPRFQEQIQRGGPITVTHPDITRFFMTIPEACQLVLQAATMGRGGEIFILKMGDPVRIVDLARDLIELSGLNPDEDIEIVFTGLRPGEKMYEELLFENEKTEETVHPSILLGRSGDRDLEDFPERVQAAIDETQAHPERVRAILAKLLGEHQITVSPEAPVAPKPKTDLEERGDEEVAA